MKYRIVHDGSDDSPYRVEVLDKDLGWRRRGRYCSTYLGARLSVWLCRREDRRKERPTKVVWQDGGVTNELPQNHIENQNGF